MKWKTPTIFALVLVLAACVSSSNEKKEEIRFLLDARNYLPAIELARELTEANPRDIESQKLLASALLGQGGFSGTPNCPQGDDGLLGLIACVSDEGAAGETDLEILSRISPSLEGILLLEEASDILSELATRETDPSDLKDIYLRLYISRLFEIAGTLTRIGVISENEVCNECENDFYPFVACVNDKKDRVPDAFDANALTPAQETRFLANLENINDDGRNAGLSSDFDLSSRLNRILNDALAEVSLADFFTVTFNDPTKAACDQDK